VNAAEVAAIGETEDAFVQFEGDIHMHALFTMVGAFQKFFATRKPEELAIEPKMHCQQAAVQDEKHVLAVAIDGANAAAFGMAGDMRSGLRLRGDGMKYVNATDSPALDKGTERTDDSFHFREFRHERCTVYGVKNPALE
jgi:hypothetical protein